MQIPQAGEQIMLQQGRVQKLFGGIQRTGEIASACMREPETKTHEHNSQRKQRQPIGRKKTLCVSVRAP